MLREEYIMDKEQGEEREVQIAKVPQAREYLPGGEAMNAVNSKDRVALYVRVSTQEQATEGVSLEAQLAALRTYARLQGWQIAGEYVDAGYSGGSDERPSLQRLLSDARKGKCTIIAVAKLDRFFRNLRIMLNCLHELEGLGIKFVATQESLDTATPYGRFAVQIMGVIAEFETGTYRRAGKGWAPLPHQSGPLAVRQDPLRLPVAAQRAEMGGR
jgi:predicted site-specific integrase-resolvase